LIHQEEIDGETKGLLVWYTKETLSQKLCLKVTSLATSHLSLMQVVGMLTYGLNSAEKKMSTNRDKVTGL
jgi:hypothetical protein